jgi:hypothetical protein
VTFVRSPTFTKFVSGVIISGSRPDNLSPLAPEGGIENVLFLFIIVSDMAVELRTKIVLKLRTSRL